MKKIILIITLIITLMVASFVGGIIATFYNIKVNHIIPSNDGGEIITIDVFGQLLNYYYEKEV